MNLAYRIGIIGTGVGLRSLGPALERAGVGQVVALSGSSPERAKELAGEAFGGHIAASAEELCSMDLDLIAVASPTAFHVDHARLALASGANVYIEKPTGIDQTEALAVDQAAIAASGISLVGHQLRFNPYLVAMRREILDGAIGHIYSLSIRHQGGGFASPTRAWTWEFDASMGGGVRLAMGSHLIDLTNFLLDSRPVWVSSVGDAVHRRRTPEGDASSRPVSASAFWAASGVWDETYVELSTSAAAFSGFGFEVVARGTYGELRFDPTARLRRFASSEGVAVCAPDVDAKYDSRPGSSLFSRSTTYLADAIVAAFPGGRPPADAASTRDAVQVSSILDACYESAQNGRVVDLASVSKFRLDAF